MNIFAVSTNQAKCAQMLDDKRLVKMVLETAQMLSTVSGGPYKSTHSKHPCTLWVAESRQNYWWARVLLQALTTEYTFRYNKIHKCDTLQDKFTAVIGNAFPNAGLTMFADCSGFDSDNIFKNYQDCMNLKWFTDKRDPQWTRRGPPSWYGVI